MDGLMIGLDLCDNYSLVSCGEDRTWGFPTALCRKKDPEEWLIGEEAYLSALNGEGAIVDQLLSIVMKDGTATPGGVKYTGLDLLKLYLKKLLEVPGAGAGEKIAQLVIAVEDMEIKLLDALMYCADDLGIPRDRVHIISHTESFVCYVLNQKKEIWNNQVGLFDLSEGALRYYEMKVLRGMKKAAVMAEHEDMEESFHLDVLETPSGARLADKILLSCGERLLQKKLFSAVFLSGKGFQRQDWAEQFMKMVCSKRRVYVETELFAKGAAYLAADYGSGRYSYPFACICEGRLHSTVSMKVLHKGRDSQLVLAAAGDSWYESKSTAELIVDGETELELQITPMDPKNKKTVKIPLEGFPDRPPRTTRISVSIGFLNENTMAVAVKDKGFGEIFPAADVTVRQEVKL